MMAIVILTFLWLILVSVDVLVQRRKRQLAEYSAQEWKLKAEATARVADRYSRELADALDKKPLVVTQTALDRNAPRHLCGLQGFGVGPDGANDVCPACSAKG